MAKSKIEPESLLPLTPAVFHVLLALADGERHGYAIMQEVTESTDGQIKMGPGTLYGTVKRLLEAELIEESDERPDAKLDDERRRYYRLTGVGAKVVRAEAQRYAAIVAHARGKKLIGKAARSFLESGVMVGRVTPCAPSPGLASPGARGATRPTLLPCVPWVWLTLRKVSA